MRIQKTFKNAALMTANNGHIEIYCNHKTLSFNNASLVSINGGTIIIETDWEPTEGELIKITGGGIDVYAIFKKREENDLWDYGYITFTSMLSYNSSNIPWSINPKVVITPASEEENKRFHECWKQKGQVWNPMTLQWEKYKRKPEKGELYYTIMRESGKLRIFSALWWNKEIDQNCYEQKNCFETEEEAEEKLNQIIQLLKE